jgi:surface protein
MKNLIKKVFIVGTVLFSATSVANSGNVLRFGETSSPRLNQSSDIVGNDYPICVKGQPLVTLNELKIMIANSDDVTNICTSKITNMSMLFMGNTSFNQDISNWDVSNVTSMSYMFHGAKRFNADISRWNVSKVKNMTYMFQLTQDFNQPIGIWNVSNVNFMTKMFSEARGMGQDLSGWDVSNVQGYTQFSLLTKMPPEYLPEFNKQ